MIQSRIDIKDSNGTVLFSHDELACKGTGKVRLADGFDLKLIELRQKLDQPMVVTSCCRSRSYNERVGGKPRSFHIYDEPQWPTGGCAAIDITRTSPAFTRDLVKFSLNLGWTVGVGSTFVHLDRRIDYTDLPQTVFTYS